MNHQYFGLFAKGLLFAGGRLPRMAAAVEAKWGNTQVRGIDDHRGLFPTAVDWPVNARRTTWWLKGAIATAFAGTANFSVDFEVMQMRSHGEINNNLLAPVVPPITVWSEQKTVSLSAEVRF